MDGWTMSPWIGRMVGLFNSNIILQRKQQLIHLTQDIFVSPRKRASLLYRKCSYPSNCDNSRAEGSSEEADAGQWSKGWGSWLIILSTSFRVSFSCFVTSTYPSFPPHFAPPSPQPFTMLSRLSLPSEHSLLIEGSLMHKESSHRYLSVLINSISASLE